MSGAEEERRRAGATARAPWALARGAQGDSVRAGTVPLAVRWARRAGMHGARSCRQCSAGRAARGRAHAAAVRRWDMCEGRHSAIMFWGALGGGSPDCQQRTFFLSRGFYNNYVKSAVSMDGLWDP